MSDLKRQLGLLLFWSSWLLWGLMLLIPIIFDLDATTLAVTITSLLVSAEISFAVSLLLLGRTYYNEFKMRLRPLWQRLRNRVE